MMMGNGYTDGKKHVFVLKTQSGEMVIATDDVEEIVRQEWFRCFLNIGAVQVQEPIRQEKMNPLTPMEIARMGAEMEVEAARDAARRQQAMPRPPVPMARPAAQFDPMNVNPDDMNEQIWATMPPAQRQAYYQKWGLVQQ